MGLIDKNKVINKIYLLEFNNFSDTFGMKTPLKHSLRLKTELPNLVLNTKE